MIAPMEKVLVAGRTLEKRAILEAVRGAGVVHAEPVGPRELLALPAVREELVLADRALEILEGVTLPADRCPPEHTPPVVIERVLAAAASLEACRGGCRYRAELLGRAAGRDLYRCSLYGVRSPGA